MNQVRSITVEDFANDCPVPLEFAARIAWAEPDSLAGLLDGIPEGTRARRAVWLYGRSHTHELGVQVAAACEGASLRRAAAIVGNQLYDLSRRPYTPPSQGMHGSAGRRQVSLGGSRAVAYA
ncbi:hypothetical protein [Methylobacterium sp. GC_Met_2]|uniref:hypothetical protein n=1 Tax=Methylobacterium sp. GC_Met_2 TaxID=2937376 RepID=UPI00226BB4C6